MKQKRAVRYIWRIGIALVIFSLCAVMRDMFSQPTVQELCGVISDCCVVAGVILAGIGGLQWMASIGFYDIMGYGGQTILGHFQKVGRHALDRQESYFDYKSRKAAERKKWEPYTLIVGLAFIALAALFLVLYYLL